MYDTDTSATQQLGGRWYSEVGPFSTTDTVTVSGKLMEKGQAYLPLSLGLSGPLSEPAVPGLLVDVDHRVSCFVKNRMGSCPTDRDSP